MDGQYGGRGPLLEPSLWKERTMCDHHLLRGLSIAKALLLASILSLLASEAFSQSTVPYSRLQRLTRGRGHHWLNWTDTQVRTWIQTQKAMGFRNVRLYTNISDVCTNGNITTPSQAGVDMFKRYCQVAKEEGFMLILDLLHYGTGGSLHGGGWMDNGGADMANFWKFYAKGLAQTDPEYVAFELINEPGGPTADQFNALQKRVVDSIRTVAPNHTIVCCFLNSWYDIPSIVGGCKVLADPNCVYNCHFYIPPAFCCDGESWAGQPYQGLIYPSPSVYDSTRMDADLKVFHDWLAQNRRFGTINEWGVWSHTDVPSRHRYYKDFSGICDKYMILWSQWADCLYADDSAWLNFDKKPAIDNLPGAFTSVSVSPSYTALKPGQTLQFTAQPVSEYGIVLQTVPSAISWLTSGGGAISASGLFTAQAIEGGPFTVTSRITLGGQTKDGTAQVLVSSRTSGLHYAYYAGAFSALPNFSTLTPTSEGITDNFNLSVAPRTQNIALRFTGYIRIPSDGQYTFFMTIDDEASLQIDGSEILRANWTQGERSVTRTLTAGMHPITLEFYQGSGGVGIDVKWQTPGGAKETIPSAVLFLDNGATAVPRFVAARAGGTDMPAAIYNLQGKRLGVLPGTACGEFKAWRPAAHGAVIAVPHAPNGAQMKLTIK
jgi:hypothetical protein